MCCSEKQERCRKPGNLKGRPQDCSPEQIHQCHGNAAEHRCGRK